MGTRATYSFSGQNKKTQHVYIHWDGYPSGAAYYFQGAVTRLRERLKSAPSAERGGLFEAFIRANVQAEITSDPDMHGDTEFHYEVEEGYFVEENFNLRAYQYKWHPSDTADQRVRSIIWSGKLVEFLALGEDAQNNLIRRA